MISKKSSRFSGGSGGGGGSVAGALTRYFERTIYGSTLTTGEIFAFTAPANGTIKRVDGFLGTVGSTDVTFDVKKNGTGTGLTVTVNNSTNGTSTDRRYGTATASISVAAGDEITVEVTDDGSTGDNLSVSFLVE